MNIAKAGSWRGYHIFTDDISLYICIHTHIWSYMVSICMLFHFSKSDIICVCVCKYNYIYIFICMWFQRNMYSSCPLFLPEISNLSIPFLPFYPPSPVASQEAKKSSKDEAGRTSSKEDVKVEDMTDAWRWWMAYGSWMTAIWGVSTNVWLTMYGLLKNH